MAGAGHADLEPLCYTEKASPTRHRPERQHNARANRRKPQRNQTILQADTPAQKANYSYKRSHPRRWKPTHTRLTYTRMRPHAPSHQAGDHPAPAHTELHNPPRLRTQRQSGLPPRAASSFCEGVSRRSLVWFRWVCTALAIVLFWVDCHFDSWVLLGLLCSLRVTHDSIESNACNQILGSILLHMGLAIACY